jgi:ABC-type multidrug transport system ATPase subunit
VNDRADARAAVLAVVAVSKRLGARKVLDAASLSLAPGELAALVGENGVGKSTLLRVVAGIVAPDAGDVHIAGHSLGAARTRALASLGFVPEKADLPEHLRASEWLDLVAALKRAPRAGAALLDELGASPFVHQRLGSLSLGQARRIALAAALIGAPRVLVLDEPTNGLDAEAMDVLAGVLTRARGTGEPGRARAVLFATHDRAYARRLDARVLTLADGRIEPRPA